LGEKVEAQGHLERLYPPGPIHLCSGKDLRLFFQASTLWLEKNAELINLLNVFPIPDGDTGTNMLLTMRAATEEAGCCPENSASAVMEAIAHGSLMGARGNSGVILSQLLRGMAQRLAGKEAITASEFAEALAGGSAAAYQAVIQPVEGTILTVAREVTEATTGAAAESGDFLHIFETIVATAQSAVAKTQNMLPALQEAGVVDAGGQGLSVIFEGILRFLKGESLETAPSLEMIPQLAFVTDSQGYGYDTQFVLRGNNLNPGRISVQFGHMGESVVIAGDAELVRVHIHTMHPSQVLEYAGRLGTLSDVTVENLQEQQQEYRRVIQAARPPIAPEAITDIATIVVALGEGFKRVFESMGASKVVSGGQTMNPSTQELLEAIESVKAKHVILLPNNKNTILVAQQAQALSSKRVAIVPTETVPQGVCALFAFNYDADLSRNVAAMTEAARNIQTAEITTSVRSTRVGGLPIQQGEVIGLLNGMLTTRGLDLEEVALEMLREMQAEECEIITVYYGEDVAPPDAERLAERMRAEYPHQEVELVEGGQPHYYYILSAE